MARSAVNNPRQIRKKSCGCPLCTEEYRPGEKPTRKSCTGSWQYRYRDPSGRQCAENFDTKDDAKDFGNAVRTSIRNGTYLDPKRARVTLTKWWSMWWPNQRAARNTLNRDERMWRLHVEPTFGNWPICEIDWLDVDRWVKKLDGPLSASSIPAAFQILDRLMTAAVLDKRRLHNPCDKIKLPKRKKKHPEDRKPPTDAQLELIREHLPKHHHPITHVAQETGLRFGELAGLRLCNIDFEGARLQVREVMEDARGHLARKEYPKSDAGLRTVPLTPLAIEALEMQLARIPAVATRTAPADGMHSEELVFRGARRAELRQANFRTTWVNAIQRAGVARITVNPKNGRKEWWPQFHTVRHAFASRLHDLGVPEVVVQEVLGHERGGDVTWIYTHAAADVAGQVLAALTQARPPLRAVESTSSPHSHQTPPTLADLHRTSNQG